MPFFLVTLPIKFFENTGPTGFDSKIGPINKHAGPCVLALKKNAQALTGDNNYALAA